MARSTRTTIVGAGVAALALSGAGLTLGLAQAADRSGPQAGGEAAAKLSPRTADANVTTCRGRAQVQSLTKVNRAPTTFGEGADKLLPGADLVVKGPKKGTDTLDIAFSAETQLRGSTATDYFDWVELEVHVDGVPIQPYGNPGDPLAFTGSREYSSNAAQFCTKIGRGKHKVTVVSRIVDNGKDDTLTAWFDDTTLHVERSK